MQKMTLTLQRNDFCLIPWGNVILGGELQIDAKKKKKKKKQL